MFALIVRYNILKLLFTIIIIKDLELYQIDITSIYLIGKLDKIIYMYLPEGYTIKEEKYYYFKKSIYSLK